MEDRLTLLQRISALGEEIARTQNDLTALAAEAANSASRLHGRLSDAQKRIGVRLAEFRPVTDSICTVHETLERRGDQIVCGGDSRPLDYDALCFEERAAAADRDLIGAIRAILTDGLSAATASAFCRNYNTLALMAKAPVPAPPPGWMDGPAKEKYAEKKERIEQLQRERETLREALAAQTGSDLPPDLRRIPQTFERDVAVPLGCADCSALVPGENLPGVVTSWALRKDGALLLRAKEGAPAAEVVKHILLNALYAYPASAKRILVCDRISDAALLSFYGALHDELPLLCFHAKSAVAETTDAELLSAFEELDRLVSNRISLLGRAEAADLLAYNADNPDNAQPLVFTVLYGYPSGFSHAAEPLRRVLKNGRQAGVYFLLVSFPEPSAPEEWGREKLPPAEELAGRTLDLFPGNGKYAFRENGIGFTLLAEDGSVQEELGALKRKFSEDGGAVELDAILPQGSGEALRRTQYSKTLSIPIGKSGSKPLLLELDSEGDAHAILCGTTGSGKSSLLNTLILSAASLYSPDELEINLISLVKSEFDAYKTFALPHLNTLITRDDVIGAVDVLNYLQDLMQSRMNTVGSDIVSYNASAPAGKRVPRCLIVIDEYQRLITDENGAINDAALNKMRAIAQLGRSCGISLILSSQVVPIGLRSDLSLFRHLFEFRGSAAGGLIPEAAARKNELEGLPGLCFYAHGEQVVLGRIAYAGKTDSAEFSGRIAKIRASYPQAEMHLRSEIVETVPLPGEIPFLSAHPEREYREEGICRVRLGRKYLSGAPLEYQFSYKNSVLCLCGEYLLTKNIEAAIIKDVLCLSAGADCGTLFYIDLNKNLNWARKKTIVRCMRDAWMSGSDGRFRYYAGAQFEEALDDLEALVEERESGDCEIPPAIAMITCTEQIDRDSEEYDRLESVLSRGKNCNLFFVLQYNEYTRYPIDEFEDAILLPDRCYEGEAPSSSGLLQFLSHTQAAETSARELFRSLVKKPLDPRLNLLCDNNETACFIPYGYTEETLAEFLERK